MSLCHSVRDVVGATPRARPCHHQQLPPCSAAPSGHSFPLLSIPTLPHPAQQDSPGSQEQRIPAQRIPDPVTASLGTETSAPSQPLPWGKPPKLPQSSREHLERVSSLAPKAPLAGASPPARNPRGKSSKSPQSGDGLPAASLDFTPPQEKRPKSCSALRASRTNPSRIADFQTRGCALLPCGTRDPAAKVTKKWQHLEPLSRAAAVAPPCAARAERAPQPRPEPCRHRSRS